MGAVGDRARTPASFTVGGQEPLFVTAWAPKALSEKVSDLSVESPSPAQGRTPQGPVACQDGLDYANSKYYGIDTFVPSFGGSRQLLVYVDRDDVDF